MRRNFLAGLVAVALVTPVVANANDWYVIENSNNKCVKDKGPAHYIKIMQDLKLPYRADDTVRDGKIVKTVVRDRDAGITVTYYSGKHECLMAQENKFSRQNRELDKYR